MLALPDPYREALAHAAGLLKLGFRREQISFSFDGSNYLLCVTQGESRCVLSMGELTNADPAKVLRFSDDLREAFRHGLLDDKFAALTARSVVQASLPLFERYLRSQGVFVPRAVN